MPGGTLTWASLPIIVISAIVSSFFAWMISTRIDRQRTWLAAQQRNLELLIKARLKEYPALYSLLSDIPKAFDRWPTVTLDPPGLLKKFNEWDSQHAILMTRDTSNKCYEFRNALVQAVHDGCLPSNIEQFRHLLGLEQELEHALRSDLGVEGFELDRQGGPTPKKEKWWGVS